jgi:endoglucanase
MNGTLTWIGIIVTAVSLANSLQVHAQGFLHARGHDIVDEKGNKVMLRGVGLGNWMLPEGYMWRFGPSADRPRRIEKLVADLIGQESADRFWVQYRKDYITEADIQRIAELGFNSVRPALNSRLFLTEGDDSKHVDEGFELLDDLVARCKKHGIYVIIDMHGAPGGQTGQNIDDSRDDQPELFKIVQRYKDEPTVAGYDLLNEPLPRRTGAREKFGDQLEPLYKRLTSEIRKIDSKHMIILEGADWANDWSVFSQPFDDNLVYQFHYYCWDRPDNLNDVTRFLNYRQKFNRPVWVGETDEKNDTIYWATTQLFESHNIGWSFWPWKKMEADNAPYSIKPPLQWSQVQEYSRGGAKPPTQVSKQAFDELLQNIKLENCVFHEDVVNSVLRRVPVKIQAENYDSYSLKSQQNKSEHYRKNEPVPIELIGWPSTLPATTRPSGPRNSEQAIRLSQGEWTGYTVHCAQPIACAVRLRARAADAAPAELLITVREAPQVQRVSIDSEKWEEMNSGTANLGTGENRIKIQCIQGTVLVDWLWLQP